MNLILKTRRLSDDLYTLFHGRETPSTVLRQFLAAGAHDAVHEHHRAIAVLVDEGFCGSAYVLLRAMFDGCLRGLWLVHVATDEEVNRFSEEKYDPKPERVLKILEGKNVTGVGMLRQIYDSGWTLMSSYVHGGIQQIAGRLESDFVGSSYGEQEVRTLLEHANWFALLAAVELAGIACDEQLLESLRDVAEKYGEVQA